MKKIAIVTINDTNNYGNRLQNYALQEFIKKYGFECDTIYFKRRLVEKLKEEIKNFVKFFLPTWHIKRVKEIRFKKFTKKYISLVKKNNKELNNIKYEYNYFVVGSDQVWNYTYMVGLDKYFLPYAEYEQAISYAASFGVSTVEEQYIDIIKKGLSNIKYLSTREEQGRKIIKELNGREAKVLVDPTLLIDRQEWEKIEQKPKKLSDKKYILVYFLGENEYANKIQLLAKKYNLDVIDISNIKDKKNYPLNPNEFIYLFDNAELVYTDSFHACVFSIIFNKPFFVFDRKQLGVQSMNSRLDTLLKMFNQEHRKVNEIKQDKEIFKVDYSNTEDVLKKEKQKSKNFFEEIFK